MRNPMVLVAATLVALLWFAPAGAQDSQSAEEQRKAQIGALFADAARFRDAGDYGRCLDALGNIVTLANIPDAFKRKDEATLYRATNEVVRIRSLIAKETEAQVQVIVGVRAAIHRAAERLDFILVQIGDWEEPTREAGLGVTAYFVTDAKTSLLQDGFARDRASVVAGVKATTGRVTALADRVCQAQSRDDAGPAVQEIAANMSQAEKIGGQAEGWQLRRAERQQISPGDLSRTTMSHVEERIRQLDGYSAAIDRKVLEYEKSCVQAQESLERILAAVRPLVERLAREQQKFEPLQALYRRCGDIVRFGEDQTAGWSVLAPSGGIDAARGRVAALEAARARTQRWDSAKTRDAVSRTAMESERLAAAWAEVTRAVADTDAAAASVRSAVSEIRLHRDRARSCVDGLGQRSSAAPPAVTAQPPPPPPATPPAAAGAQAAGTTATTTPQAPPTQAAQPPQAAPPASGAVPVTPPTVDPNVAGGIKIQGPTTRIGVGERVRFVATDFGNRLYTKVTWTSFDDELLSIDSQGRATGLRPGRLLIHAALDDERAATLSVEVVDRPAAPPSPAAPAAPPAPPASPTSGFQAGTTQAGPDNSRPAADRPAPATDPPPPTQASGGGRPSTSLLGVDIQGAPTPPAAGGFGVGATTAGRDPAPPSPGGGGQSGGGGGSGGQNPQRGTPPPGPGPQTRAVAGQPAAYHIFATGSRMGWASGLGQYSVGPADASIVEHLQVAGEHMMWANRESFLPVTAWPNWPTNRAEVRSWADDLARDPRNPTRRQITVRASSRAATLADELRYQTMGSPEYTATCDAAYMRLGYELGYGQQVLGIADEAARNGDRALARQARQDGMSHLQNSSRILSEYERIVPLTGRCADLRDVRTQLDAIYRLEIGDLAGQSTSASSAWQLAIERIVALRSGQPAPPATPFFPPVPQVPPSAPPPPARDPTGSQPQPPGSDPRDLVGMWFECAAEPYDESNQNDRVRPEMPQALDRLSACLRDGPGPTSTLGGGRFGKGGFMVKFTKSGHQYVGRVAADSPRLFNRREPWGGAAFQYAPAGEVFRLTQTVPGTYEGEIFDRSGNCVPGACNPRWWATRIVVEGDVARQVFPYFREKIYWVRWPPQHQAPASRQPAP